MVALPLTQRDRATVWRPAPSRVTLALVVLMVAVSVASLGIGAAGLPLGELVAAFTGDGLTAREAVILYDIRLPRLAMGLLAGAAVAVAGGIGFVGILVPHLLRLSCGPDHRSLLSQAALLGGTLLVAADMVARKLIAPAELPIGIVTACLGAPVFLWILLCRRGDLGL